MTENTPNACPFCGKHETTIAAVPGKNCHYAYHVACLACHAMGPESSNVTDAAELWLARAPATETKRCDYCGKTDHSELACEKVKSFEFFQYATGVKRVKFKTAADYPPMVIADYSGSSHMLSAAEIANLEREAKGSATSSDDSPAS